jgi:hypothetical protein
MLPPIPTGDNVVHRANDAGRALNETNKMELKAPLSLF